MLSLFCQRTSLQVSSISAEKTCLQRLELASFTSLLTRSQYSPFMVREAECSNSPSSPSAHPPHFCFTMTPHSTSTDNSIGLFRAFSQPIMILITSRKQYTNLSHYRRPTARNEKDKSALQDIAELAILDIRQVEESLSPTTLG